MPTHPKPAATEILTRQRIAAAFTMLTDPDSQSSTPVQLDDDERQTIAGVVAHSSHPLAGFAQTVLEEWDDLGLDDQVAGLLLFTEIVNRTGTQREQRLGVER